MLEVAYRPVMRDRWKIEAWLTVFLLVFGLFGLPYAIYLVGQWLVEPYEGESGFLGLTGAIWAALGRGQITAWILVLSPYLVVQLIRLGARVWRARIPVSHVTKQHPRR